MFASDAVPIWPDRLVLRLPGRLMRAGPRWFERAIRFDGDVDRRVVETYTALAVVDDPLDNATLAETALRVAAV